MRRLAIVGFLALIALGSRAWGQIELSAETTRTNFLLFERVELLVTITNEGDSDLVLNNEEGSPWLTFMVNKHNRLPVRQERDSNFAPLTLKVGESKTLKVNLTPLYSFREDGDYSASAVVDLPGQGQVVSQPVPFTVANGRTVASESRPVDGSQRVYSLIRFSPTIDTTELYLRVEGPSENVVYANVGLGELASSVDPSFYFDPTGNIHILQPVAMGTYLYTRADANGKVLGQRIFKTLREIRPQLVKLEDGNVIVYGGLEENPNTPQERLSDSQHGRVAQQNAAPVAEPAATPAVAPEALPGTGASARVGP